MKKVLLTLFCFAMLLCKTTYAGNGQCGFDTTVTQSFVGELSTSVSGATYQWLFCIGGGYPINNATGQTYTPIFGGQYAVAITKNGCTDTTACINTNTFAQGVCSFNNTITETNGVMTCSVPNATYQWFNCNAGGEPIPNATNQSFTPPFAGLYAVAVTLNNCTDTSACVEAQTDAHTSISNIGINQPAKLYPNPAQDVLHIEFPETNTLHTVQIRNLLGQILYTSDATNKSKLTIPVHHLAPGWYAVSYNTNSTTLSATRFFKTQ